MRSNPSGAVVTSSSAKRERRSYSNGGYLEHHVRLLPRRREPWRTSEAPEEDASTSSAWGLLGSLFLGAAFFYLYSLLLLLTDLLGGFLLLLQRSTSPRTSYTSGKAHMVMNHLVTDGNAFLASHRTPFSWGYRVVKRWRVYVTMSSRSTLPPRAFVHGRFGERRSGHHHGTCGSEMVLGSSM